jgi:N-acetylneuraminate synthase
MIDLGHKKISDGLRPFIVAEISGNHNGDINRAFAIIDAAYEAGADAVKLQTYTADTMTLDSSNEEFQVTDKNNPWFGYSLHTLYDEAHTPWQWHKELFNYINDKGMVPFSSPFDETAVDFLESLGCSIYKVASFELTDIPLIEHIAKTGKPIIMSTGMASLAEIDEAIKAVRRFSQAEIVLLKCTSTYPAKATNSNLNTINNLRAWSKVQVGLSDHTMGCGVAVAATALGVSVIEKHLTLSRAEGGVDASFSMEPEEFKTLVKEVNTAYDAMGGVVYGGTRDEEKSKMYRRSIYFKHGIKQGQEITRDHLAIVRPALGLAPKYINSVLGKLARVDIEPGTASSWELIE